MYLKVLLIVSGITLANNITVITMLLLLNGENGNKTCLEQKDIPNKSEAQFSNIFLSQSM